MTLPEATTHRDRLLTLNVETAPRLPTEVPGVTITPLFLDRENGVWVLYGCFAPGTVLPTHFHTGTVHFYTTKGRWNYVEYPGDPQTAGSYLYEPGGSIHTSRCRRRQARRRRASWSCTAPTSISSAANTTASWTRARSKRRSSARCRPA